MGLDGVELIMEVEDQFDIGIPEDAPGYPFTTVGDLHAFVVKQLDNKGKIDRTDRTKCLSSATFHMFRRALVDEYGLNPKDIRPSS